MKEENLVGPDHLFHEYFESRKGGVGNHEAAAILYFAEGLFAFLTEANQHLELISKGVATIAIKASIKD